MSTVTHTATIEASKTATWNVLNDFGGVHRWHFNIESSPLSSANNEGLGATRVCRFYNGPELTERIVEYEEGEFMNIAFVEFKLPLKRANVTFRVRELTKTKTEVTVTMDYVMRFGPLGWALNKAFLQPTLRKVFRNMLDGLNHHTVTGELIGKDGKALTAANG